MRVLRKNEERVEGLRRENQEREEKTEREGREAEEKLRKENKAREERVKQANEEALAVLTNQNKQLEEEHRRKNKESLALLLRENEAQMARMLVKQDEEKRAARKRKARDQLEPNKHPAAPECPVCEQIFALYQKIQHFVGAGVL